MNPDSNPERKPVGRGELVAVLCGVCAALLLAEAVARVWLSYLATPDQVRRYALHTLVPSREWQWAPHHYLNYFPRPNYRKGALSHNSLGFRGEEFPAVKPAGEYRVVCLGESSMYDVSIADDGKIFTARLQALLREQYGRRNVRVVNAAAGGYDSWESLINLEFRVLDIGPDLVVVSHGTNDVHPRLVPHEKYRGDNSGMRRQWHSPRIPWWEKICLLRLFLRSAGWIHPVSLEDLTQVQGPDTAYLYSRDARRSGEIIERLKSNPPVYLERNLGNMIAVARENGVRIMLATWAYSPHRGDYAATTHYQYGFRETNEAILDVARRHGVPCFDFAGVMPQGKEYWADGRHCNEAGAQKKAELYADFLVREGLVPPEGGGGNGRK